jgi:hypothetical protein
MYNTDPGSGSTLTGMAGDQPCTTTGTVHGRGSDELVTSRCVQGGCGSAGPRRLHCSRGFPFFLCGLAMGLSHGVRDLGQWGWGHSPSFVVGIQNRGCMRVGPRRFCLELDRVGTGVLCGTCGGLVGVGSH